MEKHRFKVDLHKNLVLMLPNTFATSHIAATSRIAATARIATLF